MAAKKPAKQRKSPAKKPEAESDLIATPEYFDKSMLLISEALQQGFDVLQLENGDIVTTGIKTVITTYRWNQKTGKMTKVHAEEIHGINSMLPVLPQNNPAARQKPKKIAPNR